VHGLCAAFALRRAGLRRLTVLEARAPGHDAGSSHGQLRITRASYHERRFVQLALEARNRDWPALEAALGTELRVPTPGLFFGPRGGPFDAYLAATLGSGADVETMTAERARRQFPLLRIDDIDQALLDHTAAMVLAERTMVGLRAWLAEHEVALRWLTPATRLADDGHSMRIETPTGDIRARRVVLATGPWLARLAGTATPSVVVLRQTVGYFDVAATGAALMAPAFPVWARIGLAANEFDYGLPSHAGAGLKLARHRTEGAADDPDAASGPADTDALWALARARFAVDVRALQTTERCLYTMAPAQDLSVARHPHWSRVATITACSGHGFKFAPAIGRMAAEVALAMPT
jgi:glycine/D-amino acid oxidase-like deaminating enzyme